jgi:hypothetical protein
VVVVEPPLSVAVVDVALVVVVVDPPMLTSLVEVEAMVVVVGSETDGELDADCRESWAPHETTRTTAIAKAPIERFIRGSRQYPSAY